MLLCVIILLSLIILIMSLSKIQLKIVYEKNSSYNKATIVVLLFRRFPIYKHITSSPIKMFFKIISSKKTTYHLPKINLYDKVKLAVLDSTTLKNLQFDITFGTQDAGLTALLYGLLWNAICPILIYISMKQCQIPKKDIKITPNFNKKMLNIYFSCIFNINFVHIIRVGFNNVFSNNSIIMKDR